MELIRHIYLVTLVLSCLCMTINIFVALKIGGSSDD